MFRNFIFNNRRFKTKCTYYSNASLLSRIQANSRRQIYIAVIGSGPSAFYTIKYILGNDGSDNNKSISSSSSNQRDIKIDIIESLPVPYGLIRYGVAPDHPEVKSVSVQFQSLVEQNRDKIRFFGNVSIGKDIDFQTLRSIYAGVIIATGAQSEMNLDLPVIATATNATNSTKSSSTSALPRHSEASVTNSSQLKYVFSARQFVNWYNGHPDYTHLLDLNSNCDLHSNSISVCNQDKQQHTFADLPNITSSSSNLNATKIEHVVIVGQGNVALDCARILASDKSLLESTDISTLACKVLYDLSSPLAHIKTITLLGRRGPLQIACTIKELRELTHLSTTKRPVSIEIDSDDINSAKQLLMNDHNEFLKELNNNRPRKRIFELIQKIASTSSLLNQETSTSTSTVSSNCVQQSSSGVIIRFKFLRSPVSVQTRPFTNIDDDNSSCQQHKQPFTHKISSITCEVNTMSIGGNSNQTTSIITTDRAIEDVINNNMDQQLQPQIISSLSSSSSSSSSLFKLKSQGLGMYETIPCDMLLSSVGYKSTPIPGTPFNYITHTFPQINGRVLNEIITKNEQGEINKRKCETTSKSADFESKGNELGRVYVTGWAKRGAIGIVGSNVPDARETADSILSDYDHMKLFTPGIHKDTYRYKNEQTATTTINNNNNNSNNDDDEDDCKDLDDPIKKLHTIISNSSSSSSTSHPLNEEVKQKRKYLDSYVVDWNDYLKIDKEEVRRGALCQPPKPRDKITDRYEMLAIASSGPNDDDDDDDDKAKE